MSLLREILRIGLIGAVLLAGLALFPTLPAAAQDEPYEIVGLRTVSSKTFRNSDGSYTARTYGGTIHYFDGDGWEDISLELKNIPTDHPLYAQGYRKYCDTNALVVAGKPDISSEDFLLVSPRGENGSYGDYWLKITLRGAGYYDSSAKTDRTLQTPRSVVGSVQTDQILFENVFTNADFKYLIREGTLKEEIVLKTPSALPDPSAHGMSPASTWLVWEYELKYGGVSPRESPDLKAQSIDFSDVKDVIKFFLPVGFVVDSGGHYEDVKFKLSHENGRHFLYAGVRYDWLADPNTVYPILFDPVVTMAPGSDTFVMSGFPTSAAGGTSEDIRVADNSFAGYNICRIFVKFALSGFPSGRATEASLWMYLHTAGKTSGDWDNIGAFEVENDNWTEGSTTWNDQPAYGAMVSENGNGGATGWMNWDVFSWVDNQMGTDNMVSICLKLEDADENVKNFLTYIFYAKEKYPGWQDHGPWLDITYSNQLPTVENLKTENQTNPDNLPFNEAPVFSWDYSDNDNDPQTHYEIWVGTSSGSKNMWDSGQVENSAENATYEGYALSGGVTYYIRVRAKDNWEWSEWTAGTFKMGTNYTIVLRWEENNEPAVENATLTAYMTNYGTQENSIIDGSLENVIYSEMPYWLKLIPDSGNYWRGRIPTTMGGTITFWLTSSPIRYTFTMIDLTGWFGPEYDGKLIFKRYYGGDLMTINEDYWGASLQCDAYLMENERYQIHVKGRNNITKAIGDEMMGSETSRTVMVYGLAMEDAIWIKQDIAWSVARSAATGYITVAYEDNTGGTTDADVYIYDWYDALQTYTSFDNSVWSYTWTGPNDNNHYIVKISITHDNFDDFTENRIVAALGAYEPEEQEPSGIENVIGNPTVGASYLPLVSLFAFGVIAVVALSISAAYASTGMMAISLVAGFLVWLGWLDISMGIPILIFVLSVLWKLSEARTE